MGGGRGCRVRWKACPARSLVSINSGAGCRSGMVHAELCAGSTCVKTPWNGSLRARAGLLIEPNVIVFVTGGAAFQEVEMTLECTRTGRLCGNIPPQDLTETDAMLTNDWFGRVDYRYADFEDFRHVFFADDPLTTATVEARIWRHTA